MAVLCVVGEIAAFVGTLPIQAELLALSDATHTFFVVITSDHFEMI